MSTRGQGDNWPGPWVVTLKNNLMPEVEFEKQTFHVKSWEALIQIMQVRESTSLGLSSLISGVKRSLYLGRIL